MRISEDHDEEELSEIRRILHHILKSLHRIEEQLNGPVVMTPGKPTVKVTKE